MKFIKNKKIKDKYYIYCYAIILLGGIIFLIIQGLKMEQSWKVQLDVLFRLCLFLMNTIIPFIVYQHFMIDIFSNHQRAIDKRLYIWKSRKIIFRDRRNFFLLYVVLSFSIAFVVLNVFETTLIDQISILVGVLFSTIGINLSIFYILSSKFILSSNKKLKNFKVYDKDYTNNEIISKIVSQKDESNSIIFDKNDYFDIDTVSFLFKQCNGAIFLANNFSDVYNTFNLKTKDNFKIRQNGRFLSLIWLLQYSLVKNKEWDKAILKIFCIDYENIYLRNRKKYIDDKTLQSSKINLEEKIDHILITKA